MTLAMSLDLATSRDEAMISLQQVTLHWQIQATGLGEVPTSKSNFQHSASAQPAWTSYSYFWPTQDLTGSGSSTVLASNSSTWKREYEGPERTSTSVKWSLESYFNRSGVSCTYIMLQPETQLMLKACLAITHGIKEQKQIIKNNWQYTRYQCFRKGAYGYLLETEITLYILKVILYYFLM